MGILAVILGHSGQPALHHYTFWFHMPLFLALSGFFFKSVDSLTELRTIAWKRVKQLLVPYIAFAFFICIARYFYGVMNGTMGLGDIAYDVFKTVYGGQAMHVSMIAFWFVPCLLIVQIVFAALLLLSREHRWLPLPILLLCYALAHLESAYWPLNVPLSADVALLAIVYFAIGYYGRSAFRMFSSKPIFSTFVLLLSAAFLVLDRLGVIAYELDMKPVYYRDYFLDLVIPLTFVSLVCLASRWLERWPFSRALEYIGARSLTIMYVHIPINLAFQEFVPYRHWLAYTFVGLGGSLFIQWVIDRLKPIRSALRSLIQSRRNYPAEG